MTVLFDTNSGDNINVATNLASNVNRSCCIWAKFTIAGAGTQRSIMTLKDSGPVHSQDMTYSTGDHLVLGQSSGTSTNFPSDPTITNWTFYGSTATTAGAGSYNGYFRDNSAVAFTTLSSTGIASFTPTTLVIGQVNIASGVPAAEMGFFKEWDAVLTPTEMLAESFRATPVRVANLRRYVALSTAATAGTDTSGNGFNLTISGTLTDGASAPIFTSAASRYYYAMDSNNV